MKYRPQLTGARPDPIADKLVYKDQDVNLYKGRWPDFDKFRTYITQAVPQHAMSKGKNPEEAVETARNTNSLAVRAMEESDKGQYCFYHLEFQIKQPVQITGPGALIFTFQSENGDTTTVSDKGLLFAKSGKHFLQWRFDTVNGKVKIDKDYSPLDIDGHAPQHCYVRLPAEVRDMEIVAIMPDIERWISSSSLVTAAR